ncbi:MAG: site-specific integrase [Anaeroplasmataceae bacterium]|nr:site-specific integrase [Anaeroplasmataceae bacterium]
MNDNEVLTALASLINNASNNKGISFDLAFNNFYSYSKLNCRPATLEYYNKIYRILQRTLDQLGITNTNQITKASYKVLETTFRSHGYKNSSINKFTDLLKMIFKVNNELEYIHYNPVANIKKLRENPPEIEIISKTNMTKIMKYIDGLPKTYQYIRKKICLLLLKDTGVRINELLHLKTENIDIDNNTIYLDYTKTHDARYVFFTDSTKLVLKEYILIKPVPEEPYIDYLFINDKCTDIMSKHVIYHFFEEISNACGIEQSISPHKWRHTFITELVENNVNLTSIMKVAGHTEFNTTKKYIHQSLTNLKESILSIKK